MNWALVLIAALGATPSVDGDVQPAKLVVGDELRLGQALDLSSLPTHLREQASTLLVAVLPPGRDRLEVPRARVLTQAQAQMPVLAAWSPVGGPGAVLLRRRLAPVRPGATQCWRAIQALGAGQVLTSASVEEADCPPSTPALIGYDARLGAPRTRKALSPGEMTLGPMASAFPSIAAGQRVRLGVQVGPVRVEREVEILQSAREGQAFFARADDGSVFSSAGLTVTP